MAALPFHSASVVAVVIGIERRPVLPKYELQKQSSLNHSLASRSRLGEQ